MSLRQTQVSFDISFMPFISPSILSFRLSLTLIPSLDNPEISTTILSAYLFFLRRTWRLGASYIDACRRRTSQVAPTIVLRDSDSMPPTALGNRRVPLVGSKISNTRYPWSISGTASKQNPHRFHARIHQHRG